AVVRELRKTGVFKQVRVGNGTSAADSRVLRLENTIAEYERGGGGARYFAGIYGAGQPKIRVRTVIFTGGKVAFQCETTRSGESEGARRYGVFKSDQSIQREDIDDLARDFAS